MDSTSHKKNVWWPLLIRRKCILHSFKMPLQWILKHKHHHFSLCSRLGSKPQVPDVSVPFLPSCPDLATSVSHLVTGKVHFSPSHNIHPCCWAQFVSIHDPDYMWLRMCLCSQESSHLGWKMVLSSAVVFRQGLQIHYIPTADRLPAKVLFTENVQTCRGVSSYASNCPFHLPPLHVNLCLGWRV